MSPILLPEPENPKCAGLLNGIRYGYLLEPVLIAQVRRWQVRCAGLHDESDEREYEKAQRRVTQFYAQRPGLRRAAREAGATKQMIRDAEDFGKAEAAM